MKKKIVSLLVVGTALIAGCDQSTTSSTTSTTASAPAPASTTPVSNATSAPVAVAVVDKADAVAIVNGQYIAKSTLTDLEKEIAVRGQGQTFPKEKLIEELVQRQLLIQDALQKKLDQSTEVLTQLESARNTLLTQADLQNYLKTNPVTDADLKAEYDSKVGGANATEYKASHILVKTEDEAKKLIAELDKGGKFADLANKNSLDAKESQNGGDLGWFAAGQMVEPFSEAVAKLEKGKYSKTPVKTQFGYHIILREDSRAQTPPPFDAVKEQLKPILERKKVQTMVENLRKQAKVEILVPLVDEKPKADDKAAAGEAPVAAEKPADVKEAPAVVEKVIDGNPAATDKAPEPAKAAEPAKTEEPAKAAEPATTRHQDIISVKPDKKDEKKK